MFQSICNSWWTTERQTYAIVNPAFKAGARYKRKNYRRTGLTSVVIKTLEKIIRKLFKYLNEYKILPWKQHGFRIGCFCLNDLLAACESSFANEE